MRISVITPSFNQGEFIGHTLASVASQSHPAHEHLVFDGGSSDSTLEVLQAAGTGVCWQSKPDNGQADAVNQGLTAASGEIIAWINSDDIYYSGAFAQVVEAFIADPELDVLYGQADHLSREGEPYEDYPTAEWDPELLPYTCYLCQPAVFFRRRVIDRVGLLNENLHYCMDYEYWLRLADAGCRFGYLKQKLAGSRLYADNKTLGNRPAVHREIATMFKERYGSVPLKWVFAYAHHSTAARIDRGRHPLWFKLVVYQQTIIGQWRWNRRPGFAALRELRKSSRRQPLATFAAS